MIKVDKAEYAGAYKLYLRQDAFFPLIAAVLLGKQDGVVYVDKPGIPQRAYVEHSFGYAQIFGAENEQFDDVLRDYLVLSRLFHAHKVRLWTPAEPLFMQCSKFNANRSERQRFTLEDSVWKSRRPTFIGSSIARPLDWNEIEVVESRFQLMGRFWRSAKDFLEQAHAVVAWQAEEPVAICYAAAIAESLAEIDVITAPKFRRAGLGREVVEIFCRRSLEVGVRPVWDCFTNNKGSMALCRSVGFTPSRPPYPFYTFTR